MALPPPLSDSGGITDYIKQSFERDDFYFVQTLTEKEAETTQPFI